MAGKGKQGNLRPCVEEGRFHAPEAANEAGRAPLSVMLAGRVGTHGASGAPQQNREASVWDSVSRCEQRSDTRPTHSLTQVMAAACESSRGPCFNNLGVQRAAPQAGALMGFAQPNGDGATCTGSWGPPELDSCEPKARFRLTVSVSVSVRE